MLWSLALAAPEAVITDTDGVVGTVVVDAPIDRVRRDVFDPELMARIDAGGTTAQVVGHEGPCKIVDQVSPSSLRTVTYTIKLCPTADGVHGTLVTSNTFESYQVRWELTPVEQGTRMTYRLDLASSLMVPQFVVNRATRKGVQHMLEQLLAHYASD